MSWWKVLAGVAAGVVVTAGVVAIASAPRAAPAPLPVGKPPEPVPPAPITGGVEDDTLAKLSIRAMIQAAKSDGRIDEDEMKRLFTKAASLTPEQQSFLNAQISAGFDPEALIGDTPRGLEEPVYSAAAAAIDPDSQAETDFLAKIAAAFGIDHDQRAALHQRLGQRWPI